MPGEGPDLSEAGPAAHHGWLLLPSLHCTGWGLLPLICVHPTGNALFSKGDCDPVGVTQQLVPSQG